MNGQDGSGKPLPTTAEPDEEDDSKSTLFLRASKFRAGMKKRQGSNVSIQDIPDHDKNETVLVGVRSEQTPTKSRDGLSSSDVNCGLNRLQEPNAENKATENTKSSNRDSTGSSNSEVMATSAVSEGHYNLQGETGDLDEHKVDVSIQREVSTTSTASFSSYCSVPEASEHVNEAEDIISKDAVTKPSNTDSGPTAGPPVTLDDPSSRSESDNTGDTQSEAESWNVDDALEGTAQFLGSAGGYFFSVLGQVASSAFSLTQTAVKYLVDYNAVETWHDCDSDDDDNDDAFQDAAEDLTPRDRLYHICNELLTTEEAYVQKLGLLVKAKEKAAKIINPDIGRQMFKDVEVIWSFHHDNLLPQLKDRMKKWLQYERIGDIMRKLTPFLKLYTDYVKDFQKGTALVDAYEEKNSAFATALKNLRESKESSVSSKLKIQAHMMEPIQRVPRYELLLRDYIKRIPPDGADREDAEEALKSVAEAAAHFEEMIERDSRIGKLMAIQNKLDGAINIVQANRELLKEGVLEKVPKKNFSDKYIFLFNDMMLICNRLKLVVTKYKVKHVLNLSDIKVVRGLNLDAPSSFAVLCPQKEIDLVGSSPEDTNAWFEKIRHTVSANCSRSNSQTTENTDVPDGLKLNGVLAGGDSKPDVLWQETIHISPDEGRTWRKRWCVLHSDGKMHFYRNKNEKEESTYLDSGHFEKCLLTSTPSRKGPSVSLTSTFHKYFICDENEDVVHRLYSSLTGQSPVGKKPDL